MKILNLYSGIGGNRKLWGDEHEITAVETDNERAKVYKSFFPEDNVIVADAHSYLLDNFNNFDFIWSSPPCPSHSRINFAKTRRLDYPDVKLFQEIILLDNWFKGKFVVENVISYYEPFMPRLIKEVDRHFFWSNFRIGKFQPTQKAQIRMQGKRLCVDRFSEIFGFDLSGFDLKNKRQALRNCVHPETGKYILDCALGIIEKQNTKQVDIFDFIK
ncbi:DNA cytosine methyltransferase [Tenacibaculum sp. 190524A05c]|uniref:DNA cytosine methyltransferase n=1 Tax=Tenacibaculum platacis TaxID=3137852 RepID=UPI0031FAA459